MDDSCSTATHDFNQAEHTFSHDIGHLIDHTPDSSWGHVVESGMNTATAWGLMEKACDTNSSASTTDSNNNNNTGWGW